MAKRLTISASFAGLLGLAETFIAAELPLGEPYNCSSFDTDGCWSRGQCVAEDVLLRRPRAWRASTRRTDGARTTAAATVGA